MIDRKKLIEDLEKWKGGLDDSVQADFVRVILRAVIDRINTQPEADDWIPVSKRMPEAHVQVRASTCDSSTFEAFVNSSGEWFRDGASFEPIPVKGTEVIAWKSLSAPYQANRCENAECPYHESAGECPAREGCPGYSETAVDPILAEHNRHILKRFMGGE